jgi:hypothetical protein
MNDTSSTLTASAQQISARGDTITRRVAVIGTVIVAIAAAVLSFQALAELAIAQGYPEHLAYLFPIAVDGMMLSAAMVTTHGALRGVRLPWAYAATALGAGLSIYGNVVHSFNGTATSVVVHAVPPLFMLIGIEMALYLTRVRLDERAVQEQDERQAELKAIRAQERAQERAERKMQASAHGAPRLALPNAQEAPVAARTAVQAPSARVSVSKPSGGGSAKVNASRVQALTALTTDVDFQSAIASMTLVEAVVAVQQAVPGAVSIEAVEAGLLAKESEPRDKYRTRLSRAWKDIERRGVIGGVAAQADALADARGEGSEPRRLAMAS